MMIRDLLTAAALLLGTTLPATSQLQYNDVVIDFQQPTAQTIERMSPPVVYLDDTKPETFEKIGSYALHNNYPYYRYWQLGREDAWARHPSALGGALWLLSEKNSDRLDVVLAEAMKTAVDLKNGGITWFYPEVYPLSRMVGPYLQYSALSQSSLLAAAMSMAKQNPEKYSMFLDKIAKGIEYDYHQGGVLWQDSIFLEMPSTYSPPEVILNGWLHALLNYGDFATEFPSSRNQEIFKRNIDYLVELLPSFDDPERKISLYSNAGPISIRAVGVEGELNVEYQSKDSRFPNYHITPT